MARVESQRQKKKIFQYTYITLQMQKLSELQCQYTDHWVYLVVQLRNGRWMRSLIRNCWSVKPPEFIDLSLCNSMQPAS